jgi:hypothetical protein
LVQNTLNRFRQKTLPIPNWDNHTHKRFTHAIFLL